MSTSNCIITPAQFFARRRTQDGGYTTAVPDTRRSLALAFVVRLIEANPRASEVDKPGWSVLGRRLLFSDEDGISRVCIERSLYPESDRVFLVEFTFRFKEEGSQEWTTYDNWSARFTESEFEPVLLKLASCQILPSAVTASESKRNEKMTRLAQLLDKEAEILGQGSLPPVPDATVQAIASDPYRVRIGRGRRREYLGAMHLTALRLAEVVILVSDIVRPVLSAACADDFGAFANNQPNTRQVMAIAGAIRDAMPHDWIHVGGAIAPDGNDRRFSFEVPLYVWEEMRKTSSLRQLRIGFCFGEDYGGICINESEGCYEIGLNLSIPVIGEMLRDRGVSYWSGLIVHELAHIHIPRRDEDLSIGLDSVLYFFQRDELQAEAASMAMRWGQIGLGRCFDFGVLAEHSLGRVRSCYETLDRLPRHLDCRVNGKPLSFWRTCLQRLVARHLVYNAEAVLLHQGARDKVAYA